MIKSVVEHDGLELVEVSFGREAGRRVLRVVLDRPDAGLDLDTIAAESERISRRLDLEGFEPGPYSLEVSSPGLERALRPDRPSDFTRRVGERVRLRIARPGASAETVEGTIVRADEAAVTVAVDGAERTYPYADMAKARTVFEWGAAARPRDARAKG